MIRRIALALAAWLLLAVSAHSQIIGSGILGGSHTGSPEFPDQFDPVAWWDANYGVYTDAIIIQPPVYGSELLVNGGFETAGAGGADIWDTWVETAGDGALANETTIKHAGDDAAKLTSGATANTSIYTSVIGALAGTYKLNFWTRGDGTNAGRYEAYYNDGSGKTLYSSTSTGVTGTNYALVSLDFTLPAGTVSFTLYLECPLANGGISYFDDISLKAVTTAALNNGGFELWTTTTNAASWTESIAGTSTITREDAAANVYHGSHSATLVIDGSGSKAALQLGSSLTATAAYDYIVYLKAASGTPVVKVGTATTNNSHTITTSWVEYTGSFTADGTTLEISCATANATVYVDSVTVSGRTAATNGSDVVYLTDRSGTGNHASVVPLAQRPLLVTNQINSLPILDFDGVDDRLNTPLAGLAAATIFIVGKTTTAGDVMFGVDESNDKSYISAVAGPVIGGGVATHTDATIVSDESPASAYRIICLTYGGNGTAEALYVDGETEYEGTQSGAISTAKTYAIGALNNNDTLQNFAECEIAAILVYDSVLSANERNAVTASLQNTYSLAP